MSEYYKGLTVIFKEELHEVYVDRIKNAIELMSGVGEVLPIIYNSDDMINRRMIKCEFRKKLFEALEDI